MGSCVSFSLCYWIRFMKYSALAVLLTSLLGSYGPISPEEETDFQEDCAGSGQLTAGLRVFGLKGSRRDATCLLN